MPPQPPKAGMSTGAKIGIGCGGCLGVLLILALLGGCMAAMAGGGSDSASESVSQETEDAGQEEPAEEEPAAESGVTLTASDAGTVGDTIEDTVYTAIDVEVTNGSDEPVDVNPINFSAVLEDGTVVSDWADTIFADIDSIDAVTLQPGQKASGQIAVVGEVDVATVEMSDLLGTGDVVEADVS